MSVCFVLYILYPGHSEFDEVLLGVTIKCYSKCVCSVTAVFILFTAGNYGHVWRDACTIFNQMLHLIQKLLQGTMLPLGCLSLHKVSLFVTS
jgi:hypothetical protein